MYLWSVNKTKLKILIMEKGTKVNVNLSQEDASNLGIAKAIVNTEGIIEKPYTNGVRGHFVRVLGKTVAIADKYKALTVV